MTETKTFRVVLNGVVAAVGLCDRIESLRSTKMSISSSVSSKKRTGRLTFCEKEYPTKLSLLVWGDTKGSASGHSIIGQTNPPIVAILRYSIVSQLYTQLFYRLVSKPFVHHEDLFLASLPRSPRSELLCARLVVDVDSSHDCLECHGRS